MISNTPRHCSYTSRIPFKYYCSSTCLKLHHHSS